jgi:hypothetical protein
MKRVGILGALMAVVLLTGCVGAGKKATELADQALYQPIEYANATTPGPEVVVLPGKIKSSNYAFVQKVTANNLRDFAEIELSKDSFIVLDRADSQPFFQEIALAANLGDADALKVFRKGKFKAARWLLTFNILKAEPTVYVTKGFDGETAGAAIELVALIANKGEKSTLGSMLGKTVASAKSADTSAIWLVGLQYKIVDAATGQQVVQGYIEDKMEATTSMNSFLGATNQQSTTITLDTMAQRLIQKAVAEIDAKHKAQAAPAETAQPSGKKHKKAPEPGLSPKKEKTILADYKKKLEEQRIEQDKEEAVTAMRLHNDGYANLNQEPVLATLFKEHHDKFHKKYDKMFAISQSSPRWREKLKIDLSNISCELIEYKGDTCKLKLGGTYTMTAGSATKTYQKDEVVDMAKEDGQWKIAVWTETEDKEVK